MAQTAPGPSVLQVALGVASIVIAVIALAAGAILYIRSGFFRAAEMALNRYPAQAIQYYDFSWAALLGGGGAALVAAAASLFVKGRSRGWAIGGLLLAAATLALGFTLAA